MLQSSKNNILFECAYSMGHATIFDIKSVDVLQFQRDFVPQAKLE